jgi:Cysteine dioxygenase type I
MTTFNVAPVVAAARSARRDGTMQPPAVLLPFFKVLGTFDGAIPLSDLHAMVGSLTFTSDDLGDAIQIDTGGYVRTLVFERAHVEVLVMAWLPGQRSPIHDHAGSACGVRVVAGAARETIFTCRDDGFVEEWDERHLAAGSVRRHPRARQRGPVAGLAARHPRHPSCLLTAARADQEVRASDDHPRYDRSI